jgi:hypothetical protein
VVHAVLVVLKDHAVHADSLEPAVNVVHKDHVVHVDQEVLVVNAELQGNVVLKVFQEKLDLPALKALRECLVLPALLENKVHKDL